MLRTKRSIQILFLLASATALGCSRPGPASVHAPVAKSPAGSDKQPSGRYHAAVKLADLADRSIKESSGVVASRRNPGLYWTHNDSGDGPFIYAFDTSGKSAGVWRVAGATADDWEDIAAGPGPKAGVNYLYVGDIGDNSKDRDEVIVYRVPEPVITPADAGTTSSTPATTEPSEPIYLKYPDGPRNAEALLVHPQTGDLYIVTKRQDHPAGVYKVTAAALLEPQVQTMTKVGEIELPSVIPGLVTGGDIAPDGRRLILCDYFGGYEFTLTGSGFDTIWKEKPAVVDLGAREQGEAVCYSLDGKAVLATSEGVPSVLFETKTK
jgi:hypothetical protein